MGMRRRWIPASTNYGPQSDATIDHPNPLGAWNEVDNVPLLIAPDPGGVQPRAHSVEFLLDFSDVAVQHSPLTNWNPGSPYPGPPSRVWKYIDLDSIRFWGKTGQGRLVWSEQTEFSADIPSPIPQDMPQHIDNFSRFWGGYPSLARNRPSAFGDQVPVFNPNAGPGFELAPG